MKKILFPILALVLVLGLGIVSADDPSDPLQAGTPSGADVTMPAPTVSANGLIEQVDPATIPCENLADFEDVTGGAAPGTNYDAILVSGGLELAERFSGQTLSYNGDFDVLSGTPSGPLALQIGDPNDNVNVLGGYATGQLVDGLGPLGYPNANAVGEGSLAVMFPSYQSQFKFDIIGSDSGGFATLNFFKADGSSLGTIVIAPTDQTYGFRHTGGIREIAGFSIDNSDPAGIGYDNICYAKPIEECCPEGSPNAGDCYTPETPEDGCCEHAGGCYDGISDPAVCTVCYDGTWHSGQYCEGDECIPEFTTIAIPAVAILGLLFLISRRKQKR